MKYSSSTSAALGHQRSGSDETAAEDVEAASHQGSFSIPKADTKPDNDSSNRQVV